MRPRDDRRAGGHAPACSPVPSRRSSDAPQPRNRTRHPQHGARFRRLLPAGALTPDGRLSGRRRSATRPVRPETHTCSRCTASGPGTPDCRSRPRCARARRTTRSDSTHPLLRAPIRHILVDDRDMAPPRQDLPFYSNHEPAFFGQVFRGILENVFVIATRQQVTNRLGDGLAILCHKRPTRAHRRRSSHCRRRWFRVRARFSV